MGFRIRVAHRPLIPALLGCLLAACSGGLTATGSPPADSAAPPDPSSRSVEPSVASAYPVTLTDDAGRQVVLDSVPDRVVSLAPSNTEIVCALGACDALVGVTDVDDYPPDVATVDRVVVQTQVDVERIVASEADLVLAAGNELTPSAAIEQLDELGMTVLVLYPESLDEVYADIELVGRALDRADAATQLVDAMRARVADVTAAVEGAERPTVLYEVFYAEGTTYTAGEGSFLASLLELAGAEPVTGDAEGVLEPEALVSADPTLILLGGASYDPALATPESALEVVRARTGWAELTAVRNGDVVPYVHDVVTTRPGPRIVEGLEALAGAIHPDRFD